MADTLTPGTREYNKNYFAHTHDPAGHFLQLRAAQDASAASCPDCGRSVYKGVQPWNHRFECPTYEPHPASIAATKNQ